MIDLDEQLTEYAREWRAAQPPVPPVRVDQADAPHRRSRWMLVAAALVVAIAVGTVALVLTRSPDHTTPTVGAPPTTAPAPTTTAASVPQLDVVPLYLPVDAADIAAAGVASERLVLRTTADRPSQRQLAQTRACDIALLGVSNGQLGGFEDPESSLGQPVTPTVAAPPAPPTLRCTEDAARAAGRVREIVNALAWYRMLDQTDGDTTIKAAQQQDLACLADHGILGVTDAFIADPNGSNQAHPEWSGQTATFAECFRVVTAARAPLRQAFRDTFITDHRGELASLQRAFDDYLRAIYSAPPDAKTVTTEPDLARFDGDCIRVTDLGGAPVGFNPEAALAIAHGKIGDPAVPASRQALGRVTVCDKRSVRDRVAWVFQFPERIVVVDAGSGKVVLDRAVAPG